MGRCELNWEGRLDVIEQATGETLVVERLAGVRASNDVTGVRGARSATVVAAIYIYI
jgi:hypothetical protein